MPWQLSHNLAAHADPNGLPVASIQHLLSILAAAVQLKGDIIAAEGLSCTLSYMHITAEFPDLVIFFPVRY